MKPGEGYKVPHCKNNVLKVPNISFKELSFSPILSSSYENSGFSLKSFSMWALV